jgi:hypothetical protein
MVTPTKYTVLTAVEVTILYLPYGRLVRPSVYGSLILTIYPRRWLLLLTPSRKLHEGVL